MMLLLLCKVAVGMLLQSWTRSMLCFEESKSMSIAEVGNATMVSEILSNFLKLFYVLGFKTCSDLGIDAAISCPRLCFSVHC